MMIKLIVENGEKVYYDMAFKNQKLTFWTFCAKEI